MLADGTESIQCRLWGSLCPIAAHASISMSTILTEIHDCIELILALNMGGDIEWNLPYDLYLC